MPAVEIEAVAYLLKLVAPLVVVAGAETAFQSLASGELIVVCDHSGDGKKEEAGEHLLAAVEEAEKTFVQRQVDRCWAAVF